VADVAASPDRLVIEGEVWVHEDYDSDGIMVDGEWLTTQVREWAGDWNEHHKCLDGRFRITVERLPDAK